MTAFFGKRFGGGRANTLGSAGDEDALAAQMEIHGITLGWETSDCGSSVNFNC
jgi:hypothetical protein